MTQTTSESPNADRTEFELSQQDRHNLLRAERRRTALRILTSEAGVNDLQELAAAIAERTAGSNPDDPDTIERLTITLHHTHLPRMDDLGILDYDPESHRIDRPESLDAALPEDF